MRSFLKRVKLHWLTKKSQPPPVSILVVSFAISFWSSNYTFCTFCTSCYTAFCLVSFYCLLLSYVQDCRLAFVILCFYISLFVSKKFSFAFIFLCLSAASDTQSGVSDFTSLSGEEDSRAEQELAHPGHYFFVSFVRLFSSPWPPLDYFCLFVCFHHPGPPWSPFCLFVYFPTLVTPWLFLLGWLFSSKTDHPVHPFYYLCLFVCLF